MPDVHEPKVEEIVSLMDTPSKEDVVFVTKAFTFAKKAHTGHTRFSGEPYFNHLVETAKGLARLGMDPLTIAAGLLHDSIEDVGVTPQQIEAEFGKDVLFLVDGVTKLGHLKYHGIERHSESLRKLLVATSKDVRVLIIKLMDRLHNMRTLSHVPQEKRTRIALETLDIYAAIAHRLGMGAVRRELEDLAFEYAYPQEYETTKRLLAERTKDLLSHLEKMERTLKKELASEGITKFRTEQRIKGLYSLYKKLERKGGDIEKIYDISALRVIVPTLADCYRVLGIVHKLWRPLPNKIKDYIAFPKPNGYRSIHTTVFTGDGSILEVQIRTEKIHEEAEFGIASHVLYKETGASAETATKRASSFEWVKRLIPGLGRMRRSSEHDGGRSTKNRYTLMKVPDWVANLGDSEDEFETALKADFFNERVFAFTPKGDVIDLPIGASTIDFAYAIHSDIGEHARGAKVNGKFVPLETILNNGDIVDIETRKTAKPTVKWLDFAKTTLARRHIRNFLDAVKK